MVTNWLQSDIKMASKKNGRIIVAETNLPFTRKTLRLYFNPDELIQELKKKRFQTTGMRESENALFSQALYDYAVAALGKQEVERCMKTN